MPIRTPLMFRSFHANNPCGIVSAEQSNRRSTQLRRGTRRTAAITGNNAGQATDGCEVCGEIGRRRTALRTVSNQEFVRDVTARTNGTRLTIFSFPRSAWEHTPRAPRPASREWLRLCNANDVRDALRRTRRSHGERGNEFGSRIAVSAIISCTTLWSAKSRCHDSMASSPGASGCNVDDDCDRRSDS